MEKYKESDFSQHKIFPYIGDTPTGNMERIFLKGKYFGLLINEEFKNVQEQMCDEKNHVQKQGMGIINGYTGEGLCLLFSLNNRDSSWFELI